MPSHAVRIAPLALLLAACAVTPPPEGPAIQRLSAEEAARIGLVAPQPVTLDEIIAASRAGTPPEEIIRRLRETNSVYRLHPLEIWRLREAGVAPPVIDYMNAQQRAEEAQLAYERAAQEEAWRRHSYSGWGSCGPYYAPGWSVGAFGFRRHFGYGLGWSPPWDWPCW